MTRKYKILIKGFESSREFIDQWSKSYDDSNEDKYQKNIDKVLDEKSSFIELFRWKNGKNENISKNKMKVIESYYEKINILKSLKKNFQWDTFESVFEPTKSSTIWKIFLLHIMNPEEFPIYDQHVFRFYNFYKTGKISEIPSNRMKIYDGYKNDYKLWFNRIQKESNLNSREIDKSLFSYGKLLKTVKKYPIEIQ